MICRQSKVRRKMTTGTRGKVCGKVLKKVCKTNRVVVAPQMSGVDCNVEVSKEGQNFRAIINCSKAKTMKGQLSLNRRAIAKDDKVFDSEIKKFNVVEEEPNTIDFSVDRTFVRIFAIFISLNRKIFGQMMGPNI